MKKQNLAVVGLGYGDEGKGITTDFLCSKYPSSLVIRYSGGPQAGHTVCRNGIRHVFSSYGSGTLQNIPTYISHHCVIDPVAILNEYNVLKSKGINPRLYIDERCPVVTPYDIWKNGIDKQLYENGTCGVGVGATMQREEDLYSLTFHDLFYPEVLKIKLKLIRQYYQYCERGKFTMHERLQNFNQSCEWIISSLINQNNIYKTYGIPNIDQCNTYIFEGSQGLLLDQNIGFFPHVTRSNTGSKNIVDICGSEDIEFYLVTRAYQTRHGNGPMTNELIEHYIPDNPEETNKQNLYQGTFRKAPLDINMLHYGMSRDHVILQSHKKNLVITCMDQIKDQIFAPRQMTINGSISCFNSDTDFINTVSNILDIHSVYVSYSDDSKNIKKF